MLGYIERVSKKVTQLNNERMEKSRLMMPKSAQQILDLIPLFLHYNDSFMPCYVSDCVPSGVWKFQANAEQLKYIERFIQFDIESDLSADDKELTPSIIGIYSMGSTGSMGQSLTSDLDIWVCVDNSMTELEINLLNDKCNLISKWASALNIEVTFFIIKQNRFRKLSSESVDGENCGSSQHFLLLDEFYRSSICLAGKKILWHVIPPDMESCYDEYIEKLQEKKIISLKDWIDFGPLNKISPSEYFGANLWHLYKSIDSPYKSVLKAILLETYSWEYPHTELLSSKLKKMIHSKQDIDYKFDAYYLMLSKATTYLKVKNDSFRLDLIRRCFYLKTHEKLSQINSIQSVAWRKAILKKLSYRWDWKSDLIQELDSRKSWKIENVKKMHDMLLQSLMTSYRELMKFARKNNINSVISPEDISVLSRKLYASFEVLPGKVSLLNPQITSDLAEENLLFISSKSHMKGWHLYKSSLKPNELIGKLSLESNSYLSKLLAWSYFNGLLINETNIFLRDVYHDLNQIKLLQAINDLKNTFELDFEKTSLESLRGPCEIKELMIMINFEEDPTSKLDTKLIDTNFTNENFLSYGEHKISLVGSIDLIYKNSWNEIRTLNFTGYNSILLALKTLLGKMHNEASHPRQIDVYCYSQNLTSHLRNYVFQLVSECINMRLSTKYSSMKKQFKTLSICHKIYGLFFEAKGVTVKPLENPIDFYADISANKLKKQFDHKNILINQLNAPNVVHSFASEGLVQCFFEDCDIGFNIYILDENNKVEAYYQNTGNKNELINGMNKFYASEKNVHYETTINFNLPQFYNIIQNTEGELHIVPFKSSNSN